MNNREYRVKNSTIAEHTRSRFGRRISPGSVPFTPSNAQLKAILQRCKAGETLQAIGTVYGVSGRRLWGIIRDSGFDIREFRRNHALDILGTREPIGPSLSEVPVPPARRRILELMAKRPNLNYQEVAALSGCTRQNVQECVKKHAELIERFRQGEDLKAPPRKRKDGEFVQRVVEMYSEQPAAEVAKVFKISAHSVLNYARKLGFRKKVPKRSFKRAMSHIQRRGCATVLRGTGANLTHRA
ncbi:MAG: hypothetical protein JWM99_5239 [Verrucomicrobiales bacterium]|nr:hypothetical protein [Verrucomicrobiales bacterium]